jgi:hypothetical protein
MSNENNEKIYQQKVLDIFKRLMGVREDKKVAEIIGIIPEEFANRKRRKTLIQTIFIEAVKRGMDLNELFYPDKFQERNWETKVELRADKRQKNFEIMNQAEEWLNEEVKKNPKREFWFEVEFEKTFEEFKKWKEEKEESEESEASNLSRKVA